MLKMVKTFRKHQKGILAALVLLAMFAFVFPFDSFFGNSGQTQKKKKVTVVDNIFGRDVTNQDIENIKFDRFVANQFFVQTILTLNPQFARFVAEIEYFGSTRDEDELKDAIRLEHKADEFGIRVNDEMVRGWIKRITENKLSTEQFQEVVTKVGRQSDGVTADTMFEILRHQLRLQHARELAVGRFPGGATQVTPFEAWQFYRRLNDRLGLEVIAVSVAELAGEIPEPDEGELRQLFDKYADRLPEAISPEPGFKEPRKVSLQYASVALDAFTLAFKPELEVTDDEVKEYYESRKDLYRVPSQMESPTPAPAEVPDKPKLDSDKPEVPADGKPAKKEDDDAKKNDPDVKPAGTPPAAQKPDPDDGAELEDPSVTNSSSQETKPQESKDAQKPAGSEGEKAADKAEQKPESEPTKQESVEGEPQKKEEPPQYKPIEEVASDIRDRLTKDKARAEILKRLEQITNSVSQYGSSYATAKDKFEEEKEKDASLKFIPPEPPDFVKIVEQAGMKYSETGLVSLDEGLAKVPGLGDSIELSGGRITGRSITQVMKTKATDLFDPLGFKNFVEDYFVVWKVADEPERKPTFEESRQAVLAAYRATKARPLARARATKLADAVREAGDLTKFREQQSEIKTITIPPLSLWSSAPLYSMNMMGRQGRVQPTELPGLQFPSDEFRTNTFRLKEGEVTVAPNQPEDTYYVVVLTKREPAVLESFARSRSLIEDQVAAEQTQKAAAQWLTELRRESASRKAKTPAGN